MQRRYLTIILIPGFFAPWLAAADDLPNAETIEAQTAVIGKIVFERQDVFDLSDPSENNWLFRLANRLHIITREGTVRKQLLFEPGDRYVKRLADESERILRQNKYLHDAKIRPISVTDGVVDLSVTTRDLWSLTPEISLARSGGENRTRFGLEESNLLGRGQLLSFMRDEDVDRTSTSLEFTDKHIGQSWVWGKVAYSDNSDGDSHLLFVARPFYALDTRWSAGGWTHGDDREEVLYVLGEQAAEYRKQRDYASLFVGWSKGLQIDRVVRWTAGFVHDDNRFSAVPDPELLALIPADRKLVYPYVGVEFLEDDFRTSRNHNQIDRTEDFLMGTRIAASVGWSDKSFGADRDALMYNATVSRGFGQLSEEAFLVSAQASGRIESGDSENTELTLSARYYRTQSEKRLFYTSVSGTAGHARDLDNLVELGGDTGLRGYPLRYQNGESRMLVTVEQRYFTDWYPWRIARVGAAVFADAGRVWGDNPLGEPNLGWLKDVGLGLRFALTRSASSKVIHLDLAFPLDGDSTIDSVQILLESRGSF